MKEISAPAPEQKEKAKHGEQMFPLQQYITELSDSYPAVTAHWHEEAEFTLIEEGSCVYQAHLAVLSRPARRPHFSPADDPARDQFHSRYRHALRNLCVSHEFSRH